MPHVNQPVRTRQLMVDQRKTPQQWTWFPAWNAGYQLLFAIFVFFLLIASCRNKTETVPSERSVAIANYAVATYADASLATLQDLVTFRTVKQDGLENVDNPEFKNFTRYLEAKTAELGLDFTDFGSVVIVGLGDSSDRLGIVTHADVQPADPTKWHQDPFSLDTLSEPGNLIARGAEDDKGPLALALYAMKSLKDRGLPRKRRIELIVSYTEESDWDPFRSFLEQYDEPSLNLSLDANYPVVVAEKGWGEIHLTLGGPSETTNIPYLHSLTGGAFLSQVPEDAEAVIQGPTIEVERQLRTAIELDTDVTYTVTNSGDQLSIKARGKSAHSMEPSNGRNAITHLAATLGSVAWPDTGAARMVRMVNDLVGTGDFGSHFGDLAHSHAFMGPLTLTLAKLTPTELGYEAAISFRRPVGHTVEEIEAKIELAVETWKAETGISTLTLRTRVEEPYLLEEAPHVPVLLDVFRHYSGVRDAEPIAIGGGTNARLLPNGVSFGPAMPDSTYTGHTEHELMTHDQFLLNLRMYTAMMVELAG